ncbi:hypothetical protein M413DRAFT_342925 [Hebeloma cylindrosporum]|uniref:Uncharacterized protein n=1 Tax=Hebeloma cylindrosporum TaxID=76867 RepID=A0A0C2Y6Q4_HEBCY|nr:hypothetical protein M413DRAFT_342925 [Hebeloma cylindrosporum h7]
MVHVMGTSNDGAELMETLTLFIIVMLVLNSQNYIEVWLRDRGDDLHDNASNSPARHAGQTCGDGSSARNYLVSKIKRDIHMETLVVLEVESLGNL